MERSVLKRILLVSTAFGALASGAAAADLPSRRAPVPYVAVPVFTWTGFYIGGNAGYAFSTQRSVITTGQAAANVTTVALGARPGSVRLDEDGFTGGGQIGYNFQFGNASAVQRPLATTSSGRISVSSAPFAVASVTPSIGSWSTGPAVWRMVTSITAPTSPARCRRGSLSSPGAARTSTRVTLSAVVSSTRSPRTSACSTRMP